MFRGAFTLQTFSITEDNTQKYEVQYTAWNGIWKNCNPLEDYNLNHQDLCEEKPSQ